MRTKRTLIAALTVTLVALVFTPSAGADATDRPSNGRITFGRFDPELGDFSIWVANPDGTHQKRLTHVPSFLSDWSPNGRRIAFAYADDTRCARGDDGPRAAVTCVSSRSDGGSMRTRSGRQTASGSPSAPPRCCRGNPASPPPSGSCGPTEAGLGR